MKIFGLLGQSLSHSFSKTYFEEKFTKENLVNCKYFNFEIDKIEAFTTLIKEQQQLIGLNVTVPYKEAVIPYLDQLHEDAAAIGAVNTIKLNKNQRLVGYNTDVIGFRESIKPFLATPHSRALIFGTGGSSKAIAYALDKLSIPYYFVSRTPKEEKEISYQDLSEASIRSFKLLINCTPVGMFPNIDEVLPIAFEGIGADHLVYDLIYNPKQTQLLTAAKDRGALIVNGLSMLHLQAEASWKIWNS